MPQVPWAVDIFARLRPVWLPESFLDAAMRARGWNSLRGLDVCHADTIPSLATNVLSGAQTILLSPRSVRHPVAAASGRVPPLCNVASCLRSLRERRDGAQATLATY